MGGLYQGKSVTNILCLILERCFDGATFVVRNGSIVVTVDWACL
jgi:hypothetical protein